MPSIHKSASSRQNIIPYMIRSASSKFSLTALSSTSSLGALFSSSTSASGSSRSVFMSGIRGIMNGQDKENTVPSPSASNSSNLSHSAKATMASGGKSAKKDKTNLKRKGGSSASRYPEISAPQMAPESLEAVRARFTLVPLKKIEPSADDSELVIVTEADYENMPPPAPRPVAQLGNRF